MPAQMMVTNPYPAFHIDEVSGAQVTNNLHQAWQEGYETGLAAQMQDRCTMLLDKFQAGNLTQEERLELIRLVEDKNKTARKAGDWRRAALGFIILCGLRGEKG